MLISDYALLVDSADGRMLNITSGYQAANYTSSLSAYPAGVIVISFGGGVASVDSDHLYINPPESGDPGSNSGEDPTPGEIIVV